MVSDGVRTLLVIERPPAELIEQLILLEPLARVAAARFKCGPLSSDKSTVWLAGPPVRLKCIVDLELGPGSGGVP